MWFFVSASVLVIIFASWMIRRTHVYRHLRSGRGTNPGHIGYSGGRWNVRADDREDHGLGGGGNG